MHKMITSLAVLGMLAAGAAAAEGMMPMTGDTAMGKVFTDEKGMTLYTFDKDEGGMSACYDKCAVNWPPLLAAADAKPEGEFGLTTRKDGAMQWTYDDKPLYLWIKDTKPGDTTGDMVNDVWHVAKPD